MMHEKKEEDDLESGLRRVVKDVPFAVADYRFDQKNEMFKRAVWDEKFRPWSHRLSKEPLYQEKVGYRKIDYALRNASWNLEWGAAQGNFHSNYGLYSWEGVTDRIRPWAEKDGPVQAGPEESRM